ncbi:hypothetical protein AX16_009196 [Volvariella volvacea WC 439]|nr:hypothetical protein AX16_009196 [Volvariella volvacea WC 439]
MDLPTSPFIGTSHSPNEEEVQQIKVQIIDPCTRQLEAIKAELRERKRNELSRHIEAHILIAPNRCLLHDILSEIFVRCLPTAGFALMKTSEALYCSAAPAVPGDKLWLSIRIPCEIGRHIVMALPFSLSLSFDNYDPEFLNAQPYLSTIFTVSQPRQIVPVLDKYNRPINQTPPPPPFFSSAIKTATRPPRGVGWIELFSSFHMPKLKHLALGLYTGTDEPIARFLAALETLILEFTCFQSHDWLRDGLRKIPTWVEETHAGKSVGERYRDEQRYCTRGRQPDSRAESVDGTDYRYKPFLLSRAHAAGDAAPLERAHIAFEISTSLATPNSQAHELRLALTRRCSIQSLRRRGLWRMRGLPLEPHYPDSEATLTDVEDCWDRQIGDVDGIRCFRAVLWSVEHSPVLVGASLEMLMAYTAKSSGYC